MVLGRRIRLESECQGLEDLYFEEAEQFKYLGIVLTNW